MTFPNFLSFVRIILSPIFLFLALSNNIYLERISFVVFFIAALTDWYDGWHARKYLSVTKLGIFLDPFADKVLTSFAFYLFYLKLFMPLWMLIIIILRDIFVTLLRSYDEYKGVILQTSFIAKAKTFLQMTYIFIILTLFFLLTLDIDSEFKISIKNFIYLSQINYYLLLLVTLMTLYTGLDYFYKKIFNKEK